MIKSIHSNEQLTLGREHPWRMMLVDKIKPDVWMLKQVIPDNEQWLHTAEDKKKLDEAIAWSEVVPFSDNLAEIEAVAFRAVGYRDEQWLRRLSLHTDHDSAYH